MKSFITSILVVILFSVIAYSQTKVPEKVATAFKVKYLAAKDVEWGKESDTEFEAEFKLNGKEMSANFDASGRWLETEAKLAPKDLPAPVLATIKSQFGDSKIKKAESLQKAGEPMIYEVKLGQDETEQEVVLDPRGKVLKKEAKDEEVKESEKNEEGSEEDESGGWTKLFHMENRNFSPTGKNPYFILQPGYQLVLEGKEDHKQVRLVISVLNETEKIGNVETRVVEERESADAQLVEVSRNYFAIDKNTQDIFYFGEAVDIYRNGKVIGHEGAWRADEPGNHAGIMIPGRILIGARYYQEVAPSVAMDRAEIVDRETTLKTPAGTFEHCLKTQETTPLEPGVKEYKIYAPGIGLIKDGTLLLTKYGDNVYSN